MSRWTETFRAHPIHTILDNTRKILSEAAYPTTAGDQGRDEIARLSKVLAFVESIIRATDPDIVNSNFLGGLQGSLQNLLNETSNFFANNNVSHLQNANSHADNLLNILASQASTPLGAEIAAAQEAANAYQAAIEKTAAETRSELDILLRDSRSDFSEFKKAEKGLLDSIDRMEKRLGELESQIGSHLQNFNTAFQTSENARGERFEKWMQGYDSKLDEAFTNFTMKAGIAIQSIDNLQLQAGKVLGSVIDTSQAGAYATYATEEKKSANFYRRSAIMLMIMAALVLFIPEIAKMAKAASSYAVDWQEALYRLPFSLVLFAPALYLARESSRHRTNEITNRRREHILTTIGPYLSLLPPEKADEIKLELAKNIFSEGGPSPEDGTSETSNLLAQLANLIVKLKP